MHLRWGAGIKKKAGTAVVLPSRRKLTLVN